MAAMPTWVWVLIAIAVVTLLGVAGYFVWRRWWYHYSRRYLVRLIGKQESLSASRRTLQAILRHLADEPEEELMEFVSDPESLDRGALSEEHQRCMLLRDELSVMPMPKLLIPAADALADVAGALGAEAGRFAASNTEHEILDAIAELDLEAVDQIFDRADALMKDALEYYDIDDMAVYGGGLYI